MPLLLILLAAYLWLAALRSRERARALGRGLCANARVQLLDETVALQRLWLGRGDDGALHLYRRYRFELSTDGTDRHRGSLDTVDGRLVAHALPFAEQLASDPGDSGTPMPSRLLH